MTNKSKFTKNQAMLDHILEWVCADREREASLAESMEQCDCYMDTYTAKEFKDWLSEFDIARYVKD